MNKVCYLLPQYDKNSAENFYNGYIGNINYEVYSADGKASSYKAYDVEFGKKLELSKKLSLLTLANLGELEYDEINPELNSKIDATTYGLKMQLLIRET